MTLESEILELARKARTASLRTSELPTDVKNAWCETAADFIENDKAEILEANRADIEEARGKGVAQPLLNRLELTEPRWRDMLSGLREIAAFPDPIGSVRQMSVRPNGLRVGRMRIPLGVIGIIYESRPNVTVDAASLCLKAGNAVILRGGSEALRANLALANTLRAAAKETGVPEDAIAVVPVSDRKAIDILLEADKYLDLIIPRGGPGLIQHVSQHSRIPVIKHDAGVCSMFLDASADGAMAVDLVRNSKMRQMAYCNGLETLLVHRDAAQSAFLPVLEMLRSEGVEVRGCSRICELAEDIIPAHDADWAAEYLEPILAVRMVDDLDEAIDHIRTYGSDHTEVIVTESYQNSQDFLRRVNSSTVGVNCATGFSDGFQLGLGAEIGVSTSKMHAYGPMGIEGLTSEKFVLYGDGQTRA